MLTTEILTTDTSVAALADEWRSFDDASGTSAFLDYDWYDVWMNHLGTPAGKTPHIVIARDGGKLVGLLPLVVARKSGMRILQGMGKDAFFPCDVIVANPDIVKVLWNAAHQSPHYDFAVLGYVDSESASAAHLKTFACSRDTKPSPYIAIEWPTGEAWLESLSKQPRRELRRHAKRLEEEGVVSYRMHTSGPQLMPMIDDMLAQKTAWSTERNKTGLYDQAGVKEFFRHWVAVTAQNGQMILVVLYVDEKAIAYNLMFAHRTTIESYFITYDREWQRFSAGNLVQAHAIRWAIDGGFKEFDFMQGETASKMQFANRSRTFTEYTFSRSLLGALKERLYIALRTRKQKREEALRPAPARKSSDTPEPTALAA